MEAQLSFWNKSMSYKFNVYKTFNSTQHYDSYIAEMEGLGYTQDETWTQDEELTAYLRKGFDKALATSNIKVSFLGGRS